MIWHEIAYNFVLSLEDDFCKENNDGRTTQKGVVYRWRATVKYCHHMISNTLWTAASEKWLF